METRQTFYTSNGYRVVLIINIPTATTAGRLQGNTRQYAGVGCVDGMWHCLSIAFLLWPQNTVFQCTECCEVVQGYVILTLYTTLLHIHTFITHAVNCIFGPVEMMELKLCITCCLLRTFGKASNS
jgi:hypothetical protein